MFRKISTLLLLAGALGLVLFLKNILFQKPTPPRLIDRLPTADFIATANILDLAKETNGMLQYNKISARDFTTYEFLLGQGKMYGIDLQQNVYLRSPYRHPKDELQNELLFLNYHIRL